MFVLITEGILRLYFWMRLGRLHVTAIPSATENSKDNSFFPFILFFFFLSILQKYFMVGPWEKGDLKCVFCPSQLRARKNRRTPKTCQTLSEFYYPKATFSLGRPSYFSIRSLTLPTFTTSTLLSLTNPFLFSGSTIFICHVLGYFPGLPEFH